MNILIYNEFTGAQLQDVCTQIYPKGLHERIKESLLSNDATYKISAYTLNTVEQITDDVLYATDVVIWWGHCSHADVPDIVAKRIAKHVTMGMGIIFLHSAHMSKPFTLLMGTSCTLKWREIGESERVWVIEPTHPIAKGLGEYFEIEHEEMYGERFDVPTPDELVLLGWFKGGEVFRSGIVYKRGYGKVFYFQPGHETLPVYYNEDVMTVINNAVNYLKPVMRVKNLDCPNAEPLENI